VRDRQGLQFRAVCDLIARCVGICGRVSNAATVSRIVYEGNGLAYLLEPPPLLSTSPPNNGDPNENP